MADVVVGPIGIIRNGSDIQVTFQAAQGSTYRLERKLSLIDPTWQTIAGVLDLTAGSSGPAQITDPGAVNLGKAFYRVMLPDQFNCHALCFIERYSGNGSIPPSPTSGKRGLSTQFSKVDVGFIMDTTGSMSGELSNLKASLSTTIIPALQARIPNLGIGIAAHDDVPFSTYGTTGDTAFYISAPPLGYVTTVSANSQTAANALVTHNGLDFPESQILAIYKAITWPGGSLAADSPPAGTFGAMRFRSDAFPIVINITDASHHNGKRALDKTGTNYDATYQNTYSFATWNVDNVVTVINGVGAKFITAESGVNARGVGIDDPYGYGAYITDKTNSNLPASAFTPGPGCVAGQCCTGINGTGVTPDGPSGACRSVWSISTTGTGLGTSIVNGVVALLNGTGEVCFAFPPAQLADNFIGPTALVAGADGVFDTITQINAAPTYAFKVTPKSNTVIAATTTEQTFRAWLRVLVIRPGGAIVLGPDREVLFVVPPIGY